MVERRGNAPATQEDLDRVFRAEHARVVATLVRRFGDLDLAEDAAGEAVLEAVRRWPTDGLPPNPGGWLTTTAGNRAIDRIRRESKRDDRHRQAAMMTTDDAPEPLGVVDDDRLRLVFVCCHPALAVEARVALTLRLVCGLTVADIARGFLVAETTMAQRITRAKRKIATAGIPFRVPYREDLPARLASVLTVVYLVFNEGYLASQGEDPVRDDLSAEAIRLGRLLVELMPEEPEAQGLLALMLLTDARRTARFDGDRLVPLDEQDRRRWDRDKLAEGHRIVRHLLHVNRPGQYQILAAVNAVHTDAATIEDTDWRQVVALYDQLLAVAPSPVVELNRAVALAELDGPDVALGIVEGLPLEGYHAWYAVRADLLRRTGRTREAVEAYDAAIAATGNAGEQAFLAARRDALRP